jgi:hypothetical protein
MPEPTAAEDRPSRIYHCAFCGRNRRHYFKRVTRINGPVEAWECGQPRCYWGVVFISIPGGERV